LLNLSQYYNNQKLQGTNFAEFLELSLNHLLETTMKTLLFENIDQDLIGPASSSLLAMITARKVYFFFFFFFFFFFILYYFI